MIDRKTSFYTGIVLILVFIILLQRTCTPKCPHVDSPEVSTRVDTVYREIVKHEVKRLTIHKTDTQYVKEPWMVPDTNYAVLKKQFEDLVTKYASANIYQDTIRIDTIGVVILTDTVRQNQLRFRNYVHNYKIPTITITKQVPLPPRRQVYIGGAVGATYPVAISSVQAGMLFKDKKDRVFGASVGLDTRGVMTYSLSSYWKISLRH